MPCSAVSSLPQELMLQGVAPVCVVCALCSCLISLQFSCLQWLSFPVLGSVWSLAGVGYILTRYMLVSLLIETQSCCCQDWPA